MANEMQSVLNGMEGKSIPNAQEIVQVQMGDQ